MKQTNVQCRPALRRGAERTSACPAPTTPYRTPAPAGRVEDRSPAEDPLLGGLGILLIASLVRITPACLGHETFGTEPTLALFAVAFSGYQLGRAGLAWLRCRRPDHGE